VDQAALEKVQEHQREEAPRSQTVKPTPILKLVIQKEYCWTAHFQIETRQIQHLVLEQVDFRKG
jgi:hypothetical protein